MFADLLAVGDRAVRSQLGDGAIIYTPGAGPPVTVAGIFDAAFQRVDLGQGGVASTGPAVFLGLEDLPSDPETDPGLTVTISGVVYSAHTVERTGGGVVLHLHRG